jgi:hypothetical protein
MVIRFDPRWNLLLSYLMLIAFILPITGMLARFDPFLLWIIGRWSFGSLSSSSLRYLVNPRTAFQSGI